MLMREGGSEGRIEEEGGGEGKEGERERDT